ncbi:hypothetical protein A8W25_16135 [Streptomyces sp. ERV7]|nr:hypothetical protein A8W25_16135 [Streptomyces sp. ERV7]
MALLGSNGSWSHAAARFALSGTDSDIHAWIDMDRQLAQRQDDRESSLYLAKAGGPDVALAASRALAGSAPDAAAEFLSNGVVEAAAMDNRVAIARVLGSSPGRAVTKAANDALNAGTARALHEFLNDRYGTAQQEDDAVATATLLNTARP